MPEPTTARRKKKASRPPSRRHGDVPAAAQSTQSAQSTARRSPCPLACSLDILGDRWTLLVVRDLFLGKKRFKDFASSPEGIPTNILTDRLERLVRHGIAKQVPAEEGGKRLAYELTAKGTGLVPLLRALRDWGLKWEKGTRALLRA